MNPKVLWNISYGVYVITAMDKDRPVGCIANSVMQVTATPETIAVSISHDNFTNGCIKNTDKFAICILTEDVNPSIIGTFGFKSSKECNKFDNVSYEMKENLPILKDCCGYIICQVVDKMETDTHTVFLGKVTDGDVFDSQSSVMTYAYYHKVIKGKSPKNAPTYMAQSSEKEEKVSTSKYQCQICGYIYEGATLPDDFECPICGVGAENFKKIEG